MDFRETFSKGITKLNVKTSSFMEINKCKTFIGTLEKEIDDIKKQIGVRTYDMLKAGAVDTGELMEQVKGIDDRLAQIEEQNRKIREIEEQNQKILGEGPAAGALFCPSCGEKMAAGTKFCTKCGTKL